MVEGHGVLVEPDHFRAGTVGALDHGGGEFRELVALVVQLWWERVRVMEAIMEPRLVVRAGCETVEVDGVAAALIAQIVENRGLINSAPLESLSFHVGGGGIVTKPAFALPRMRWQGAGATTSSTAI